MNLNDRISKIIEYSELSASEFADEIDVQRSNISHITSGRNKPSLDFLIKIKNRFPELQWDWLISGMGEMVKKPEEERIVEKSKPSSLPDLFSLINDENFGVTNFEEEIKSDVSRESDIPEQSPRSSEIIDSHGLEKPKAEAKKQSTDNEGSKIKRIIWFYDNGKFESFEP